MSNKIKVAIIGPGNIGTDLLMKAMRSALSEVAEEQNIPQEFLSNKKELEAIITKQRSEIELANSRIAEEIQKFSAQQSKEQGLLKNVIQELRNELEHEKSKVEDKIQKNKH